MRNLAFGSKEEGLHSIMHLRTGFLFLTPLGEIDVDTSTSLENYAKKHLNSASLKYHGKTWEIKKSEYNGKKKIERC